MEAIRYVDPTTGEILQSMEAINIYPANTSSPLKSVSTPPSKTSVGTQRAAGFSQYRRQAAGGATEQRTTYDLEMLGQVGYCNGVENYARHLAGREPGTAPECLIDYFPHDWLLIVMRASHLLTAGHVQRRSGPQEGADRPRFPSPQRCRQPTVEGRRVLDKARQTVL